MPLCLPVVVPAWRALSTSSTKTTALVMVSNFGDERSAFLAQTFWRWRVSRPRHWLSQAGVALPPVENLQYPDPMQTPWPPLPSVFDCVLSVENSTGDDMLSPRRYLVSSAAFPALGPLSHRGQSAKALQKLLRLTSSSLDAEGIFVVG